MSRSFLQHEAQCGERRAQSLFALRGSSQKRQPDSAQIMASEDAAACKDDATVGM